MYIKCLGVILVFAVLVSCVSTDNSSRYSQTKNERAGHNADQTPPASISPNKVDTTAGVNYLTDSEKKVIIEINMVRTNPADYARKFLVPLRSYYRKKLLQYPGENAIQTKEGIRALDECIKELQVTKPLPSLYPKKGLALAARDHVRDHSKTGATGHTGSDKSTLINRIGRYGKWSISVGENIDYGNKDARRIVASMLIDDGVTSRGHRINLLDGKFKFVGVSVGPHKVYGHMCVIDFAGSYQ